MRDLVSARILMAELGERMSYKVMNTSHISKIWEDNTGTQNLANRNGPLLTFRTKHIAIKYHWFRSMIGPQIEILCVYTKEQRANIFTKGLTRFTFEQVRKRITGW